jgi:hypothetical protein
MNTPYDYASASRKFRENQQKSYRSDVKGKYNRVFLDPLVWTPANLIPGQYPTDVWYDPTKHENMDLPFWRFNSHFWPETRTGKKGFVICGRGLNDFASYELCLACMVPDHDSVMARFAYNMLGLHYYHEEKLPHPNAEKARQGKIVTNWRQCQQTATNTNCPYCNKQLPRVLGYYGHIEFGRQDQEALEALDDQLGDYCKCGGRITVYAAACNNCNQIVASVDTSGLSDAEFLRLLTNGGVCPHCNTRNHTYHKLIQCKGCATPRPLTVFDVNLQFRRPIDPAKNKPGTIEVQVVMGADGKPQVANIHPEYIKSLADRGMTLAPYDLPTIYAPLPPATLQKRIKKQFGINVSSGGLGADPNAQPRSGLPSTVGTPATPPPPAPLPPFLQAQLPPPQPATPQAPPAAAPLPPYMAPPAASTANPMLAAIGQAPPVEEEEDDPLTADDLE